MAARTLGKLRVAIIFIIVQLSLLLICWNGSSFHIIVRAASDQPKMSSTVSCFPSDGQALASFAAAVPDVYLSESWSSEHDCCTWMGVTCTDATAGYARVTGLSLLFDHLSILPSAAATSNILEVLCHLPLLSTLYLGCEASLIGDQALQVPACFGEQLPLLHSLTLSNLVGTFKGPLIPSSFSRLRHLQTLELDAIMHSINFPASICSLLPLVHLPSLTTLYLSSCAFSDPLPNFHTPLLQSLSLFEASFFSAPLMPTTFNGAPLLQSLTLVSSTRLEVDHILQSALSNLTALTELELSGILISGSMSALSNLSALTSLSLYGQMDISGPIPVFISRLSNLQRLRLELGNNLSGALPDWLCQLSHLVSLVLTNNRLSTAKLQHPEFCRQLINLTALDLSSNDFTGPFPPWIGHFRSLEILDLSSNGFAGSIPDEWKNLHNLHTISLGSTRNSPNGSKIPDWLFRHFQLRDLRLTFLGLQSDDVLCGTRVSMLNKTLERFYVYGNNITGRDLFECFALHNFTKLTEVRMSGNPLSIMLADIQLAPTISMLSLSACNLTGFLNDKLFEGLMTVLDLSHNHLVGKIPTKQANLTALSFLDLSNNHFSGFDSEFGSFTSLQFINLSSNSIAGEVESVLRILGLNCTTSTKGISSPLWYSLDLSHNELVGQIPPSNLAQCANDLQYLFLDHNNLSGAVPLNLPRYLTETRLDNNQLKGNIPASVITNSLILLELGYNELEGDLKILFSFGQSAANLQVLDLAHNLISGSIPPSLGDFMPSLIVIDLSHNMLTGNIPHNLQLPSFYNISDFFSSYYIRPWKLPPIVLKGVDRTLEVLWIDFRFLDLSHNYLEGVIPAELGEFSALMLLNLSHNRLAGPIPEAFGKLSMLEVLDLSFNKLQGSLPMSLARLTKLSVFNVSYNKELEGSIPPGPQLENKESYTGDSLLCGHPVSEKPCSQGGEARSPFHSMKNIEEASSTWIDEWIAIPGLCVGIVVGFLGTLWLLHGPQLRH